MSQSDIVATIGAVWRIEHARIIASLARSLRDVGLAEEMAQEALVSAMEKWPSTGIPDRPAAWLAATAKNRAIDALRRRKRFESKQDEIARETGDPAVEIETGIADGESIDDDLLRLIFTSCHPVLSMEARVALTLRVLGGLTTDEIARAFLVSEATIAQRIVRAKRSLSDARVPFEVPGAEDRGTRLSSVLEVIYLIFNEGYAATAGDRWTRPELCDEALRLGRILAGLMPDESEVHGLIALLEIQSSRLDARLSQTGDPILLLDQDRARWDQLLIGRGLAALKRSNATATFPGPYALQAAIAACHATARNAAETDWKAIVALYDQLLEVLPTPVVALNRAVAKSMAFGPSTALPEIDALADEPALKTYHLLPSVRGDLLAKLERWSEAAEEFSRAASLARNDKERSLLTGRAEDCRRRAAAES